MFGVDLPIILLICGVACAGTVILVIAFSFLEIVFDIVGFILGLVSQIASFGPLPGCGCVVLAVLVAGCALTGIWLTDILSTCGTAEAVNLCQLF